MKSRIWAHRGSSKAEPENTMAAFRQAIQDEADGIEIDVMFTRDRQVAVIHDERLDRLAGISAAVQDLIYSELEKVNIASHRGSDAGFHKVPLLRDVLKLLQATDLELNIELKNSVTLQLGLEEAVLALVTEHGMDGRVWYSSFNHYSIRRLAGLGQGERCGILYSEMLVEPWNYAATLGIRAIHPMYANLQIPHYAEQARENRIHVHAWTIDRPEHLEMALRMGVEAVITNVPARALDIRERLV